MSNPQKLSATITEITAHGDGVYSLRFESERRLPRFKPGQFLHLAIDEFDPSTGFWPESRVFSIATSPSPNEVTIAYSVKGLYTDRMAKELRIGNNVWLKFPYGAFIIDEIVGIDGSAILVAGGTGFTPFVSFLDREAENESKRDIALFYGVKKHTQLLFTSVIKKAMHSCKNFSLHLSLEELADTMPLPSEKGRLNAEPIIVAHENFQNAPIFLAGPPQMMESFKKSFLAAGMASDKIIIDEWE